MTLNLMQSPDEIDWDNLDEGVFEIKKGQGVNAISQNLKDAGLIKNKFVFETWVWLKGLEGEFRAGKYEFEDTKDIESLVNILTKQNTISQEHKITIIEGWNNRNIDEYLAGKGILPEGEFLDQVNVLTKDKKAQYDFLSSKPDNVDLEGYLFPDTYHLRSDADAEYIIDKLLTNFDRKLTQELRDKIESQGKTIHEVVTLASIVEKEVARDEDRRIVAGIFLNRLDIGMGLQSDATVNYVTGGKTTRPSLDDIAVESEYNTYKYRGLPPGPICNPGIASIEAVLDPVETDYLFFLTTPDNETIFSETHDDHVEAKNKYLN